MSTEHARAGGQAAQGHRLPVANPMTPTRLGATSAPAHKLPLANAGQALRRAVPHLCLTVVLLALSLVLWWRAWITGSPASTMTCKCGDPGLFLWYIASAAHSIAHLQNPFFSNAIYAHQGGANLLVDTSIIGPASLLSPITWLFGPVAAFNVLMLAVPVINGLSMFALLRRVTRFLPGQILASVMYAFSPCVIGANLYAHFHVSILFFPPLAASCLYDLALAKDPGRRSPKTIGAFLGLLCVLQFFVGSELELITVIVLGSSSCVIAMTCARQLAWSRRQDLTTAFTVAIAIS